MKINIMRYKKYLFVIVFGLMSNYGFSQKPDGCKNITNYEESVILRLLIKYYPSDSISKKHLVINGKINNIKKYYGYLSFRLPINKNEEIRIINFGTYSEHNPNFMLVLKRFGDNLEESFVLGKNNLEQDLKLLDNLFSSFLKGVDEKYKLEILNLFLQFKQGVLQTHCFIY